MLKVLFLNTKSYCFQFVSIASVTFDCLKIINAQESQLLPLIELQNDIYAHSFKICLFYYITILRVCHNFAEQIFSLTQSS